MPRTAAHRGPGRPLASKAGDAPTRTRILEHAQRLFQERGYHAVAISDIAAAVGVTSPTLYYHFARKEALYTEMVLALMQRIGEAIAQIMLSYSALPDRLYMLAYRRLYYAARPGYMDTMMRDVAVHLSAEEQARVDAAFQRHMMQPLQAIMRAGIGAGELRDEDPAFLAKVWFLLLDAFVGRTDPDNPSGSQDALARQFIRLFLEGAGVPRPPAAAHSAGPGAD